MIMMQLVPQSYMLGMNIQHMYILFIHHSVQMKIRSVQRFENGHIFVKYTR